MYGQEVAKMRFQAISLCEMHQFSVLLHFMIENNNIYYLLVVLSVEKFCLPYNRPFRAKKSQDEVLGNFLVQNASVLGDFLQYDLE